MQWLIWFFILVVVLETAIIVKWLSLIAKQLRHLSSQLNILIEKGK